MYKMMKGKLGLGALMLLSSMAAHAGAVVVSKDSPLATFDADEAKKVFLGREAVIAGQSVSVIYQKDGAIRTDFETKVLGKTGSDLSAYWSKLIFTGKAAAPDEVAGDAGVKSKLAASPGAVGYVSDAGIDGSVKVLLKY